MSFRKNIFSVLSLSMALVSPYSISAGSISVVNMNASGHLQDFTHTKDAYENLFRKINFYKIGIDFVGAEEMLYGIEEDFTTALEAANSDTNNSVDFRSIGRERGGISGQSPDEMVSIFYNANRWTLKEYSSLNDNPVLRDSCNRYTLVIGQSSTQPCELSLKAFNPAESPRNHYTFPLNYVDDNHLSSFFPGDTKDVWGPWNRLATFGVFTSTQASGISPQTTVIVVATHFPKGTANYVIYKKNAFESVYDQVIKPLIAAHPGAGIIFMGDLNYNHNRDKSYFDLKNHIREKSNFIDSFICGDDDDVLWTVATKNLNQSNKAQCIPYQLENNFKTSDHVITQTVLQLN